MFSFWSTTTAASTQRRARTSAFGRCRETKKRRKLRTKETWKRASSCQPETKKRARKTKQLQAEQLLRKTKLSKEVINENRTTDEKMKPGALYVLFILSISSDAIANAIAFQHHLDLVAGAVPHPISKNVPSNKHKTNAP